MSFTTQLSFELSAAPCDAPCSGPANLDALMSAAVWAQNNQQLLCPACNHDIKAAEPIKLELKTDRLAVVDRHQGLPATAVNFGPFGGVGMAAHAAEYMQSLGLQPLPPQAAWAAFSEAGHAPQHVRVHLDAARFARVNQARGRWSFLEMLQTAVAGTAAGEVSVHEVRGCRKYHMTLQPYMRLTSSWLQQLDEPESCLCP